MVRPSLLFGFLLAGLLGTGCASHISRTVFPEPADLPAQADLPDPLVCFNGHRVTSPAQWEYQRRPELKALFQKYMYGPLPPRPLEMHLRVTGQYPDFLDGTATLKTVQLQAVLPARPHKTLSMDLIVVVPNRRTTPAPVFLGMTICGVQALSTDPRVPLTHSWVSKYCPGCTNSAPTPLARGTEEPPLRDLLRRGYGFAAFNGGDIDSDRGDASTGIYSLLANGDPAHNNPTNRGTLAAWAWGYQRCVDYLVTDPDIARDHIIAVGHSRFGKAALLAAAFDERIGMAIPHQAGWGGTAPDRGSVGEGLTIINHRFPYWFNAAFKQFTNAPARLPFDQNGLLALCAPRPLLVTGATGDQWSNPQGAFETTIATDPVYRFLGVQGLEAACVPPCGQPVLSRLGFYMREGGHSTQPADWKVFMDFADQQWGSPTLIP